MIFFSRDPLSGLLPHFNGSQMFNPEKTLVTMKLLFVQMPLMGSNASFKKCGSPYLIQENVISKLNTEQAYIKGSAAKFQIV